jgi:hypothetical protein
MLSVAGLTLFVGDDGGGVRRTGVLAEYGVIVGVVILTLVSITLRWELVK